MVNNYIIGADEVGRGPLAGGCYVCAVMAPSDMDPIGGVTDSKKLTPQKREALYKILIESKGIHYRVSLRTASRVDEVGIQNALLECFKESIERLISVGVPVEAVRIDGKPIGVDFSPTPTEFIVKGDAKDWIIGAASIIAKVERDSYMAQMARRYPSYGWEKNKGYGSKQHLEAIEKHGLTPLHRSTFCRRFVKEKTFDNILDLFGG